MKIFVEQLIPILFLTASLVLIIPLSSAAVRTDTEDLDNKVKNFLDSHDWGWGNMNVPAVDGQTLHDIILKNNYTRALEIGTSTGHSGIWIAWALSKTGGKLITIEINERRHREALENFEAAGLSEYIDARLGDAHTIVPALEGSLDFVFSDADKGWYKNYLIAVLPKLEVGARSCRNTHPIIGQCLSSNSHNRSAVGLYRKSWNQKLQFRLPGLHQL